jgi:dihydroorotate dehydrogenase (fumarate)
MNLKTNFLGKELKNPLVVSANPLSESLDNIKQMEDAGASAIVLYSLFEEQLTLEQKSLYYHTTQGTESFAEALSYFPEPDEYKLGPDEYLNHIRKSKEAVDIPIVASLNASTPGGWAEYAKDMEAAGADAIELNIYNVPTEFDKSADELENSYLEILKTVKSHVKIPVALKLSPYFTNMASTAKKFDEAGADALVLFNRFYQPDINLDELEIEPNIILSDSSDIRIALRWIAILKYRIKADFAATGGVHTAEDVIKLMMVGANVAMMTSALLKYGINHISTVLTDLQTWMNDKEYESIMQMQGSMSKQKAADATKFERAQYMKALTNYHVGL